MADHQLRPTTEAAPRYRPGWGDRTATVTTWLVAAGIAAAFVWLLADVVLHGITQLSWEFFTAQPRDAGRSGGIGPILISTLLVLAVCLSVSVPVGLGTAAYLAEFTSSSERRFGRMVRGSLDVLAGVPSIVFGLFGNAFFCVALGMGFSILSGGLTLACMVLPIFIRVAEEGFRSVPDEYRLAAASLGMRRTRTLVHIVFPVALPGVLAGLVLGIGRALAETAALIFTSGYVDRVPQSLFDSGRTMSVHIYDLSMHVPGGESAAYGTALVLVLLLFLINVTAMLLTSQILRRHTTA